jgi:hypothetical protein
VEVCDAADLRRLLPLAGLAELVLVESQSASPQMGVSSAFSLGMAAGRLQGALEAFLGHEGCSVAPSRWKASYGLQGGRAGKVDGLALARELLGPGADACDRLERHDQADAVLIAWWGWRNLVTTRN